MSLVNAANAQPIATFDPMLNGTTITLGSLPTQQLSVGANPVGTPGSVVFSLDSSYVHTENIAPYALCGDATTTFTACPQLNVVGLHTLSVTQYSGSAGTGAASPVVTITFTVQATASGLPTISTQPSNQAATAGQNATFSVVAAGNAPLTYQWQKNSVVISGATAATYTKTGVLAADNGSTFAVVASNSLGNVTSTAATLTVTTPSTGIFPLHVSTNGRYLVGANGTPFPILGDAGWEAAHNLGPTDQQVYLSDRASRGFNAVLIEAVEHKYTGNKPPRDFSSNLPFVKRMDGATFTGSPNGTDSVNGSSLQYAADPYSNIAIQSPDFTYPSTAYWSQMDAFVNLCASNGIAVFLFPAYVGYAAGDEGWLREMVVNDAVVGTGGFGAQSWSNSTKSKLWNYGAWLAQHYASFTNIVWVLGGDFGTNPSGTFSTAQANAVSSLLTGMKSVAGQQSHLWTSHWGRPSLGSDVTLFASQLDLQSVYENAAAGLEARNGYAANPAKPAFELENYYEGDPAGGGDPDRRYLWWSFVGTAEGQFFGNVTLWPFASGWQSQLASQGSKDAAQLNTFIRSIPWQNLVPSGLSSTKTIVVANGGTAGNADYITCAADTGATAVCYVPPGWSSGTFTIDSTIMATPYRARWLNPTTGAYTLIAASTPNTGTHAFSTPGNNGSGFTDWALVLDAAQVVGNNPPTVGTTASANPSPATAATTNLSVLGADDGGEAALTYTWLATGTPPAAVVFSSNGTNAAKNTTATLSKAGSYSLQVTIADAQGASTASSVTVVVAQTLTTIVVAPSNATIAPLATQVFSASARDQFGTTLSTQPTFAWTVTGGGAISASGIFTAGSTIGGPFNAAAAASGKSGGATISIAASAPIVIGQSTVLPTDDSGNGSWLIAQQATLSQTASIQSLGFYVATTGGNLRIGIYDATGPNGGPGAKKAETAELTPAAAGWISASVVAPVSLPPGSYWLAYLSSADAMHSRRTGSGGGACQYYPFPYGPLPTSFSTTATVDNVQWSLYATLQP